MLIFIKMAFGDINHELTSVSGSAYGDPWKCISNTTNYIYHRITSSGQQKDSIAFNPTTNEWFDASASLAPTAFGESRTVLGNNFVPDGSATNLFLWNGGNWYQELINPDPISSSGGGTSTSSSTNKKVYCNFW